MNDDLLELRLSRAAALRLAAAGAAGLALGVRPARAARERRGSGRSRGARVPRVAGAGRASSCIVRVRQRRAHPLALDRAFLRAAERPAAGSDVGRAARARARPAASEQLDGRLPQGAGHHGAPGRARTVWTRASPTRSTPTSSTSRCSARRARERGAGASRATTCRGTSPSYRTRSWPSRSSSAPGRLGQTARIGRSRRATGRCRAKRTRRARSCSCSTARSASASCSPRSR